MPNTKRKTVFLRTFPIEISCGEARKPLVAPALIDWIDPAIPRKMLWPPTGQRIQYESSIISFLEEITTDEVQVICQNHGLTPASIIALIALAPYYAVDRFKIDIVSLGDSWIGVDGIRWVARLSSFGGTLLLKTDWYRKRWNAGACFLTLRSN